MSRAKDRPKERPIIPEPQGETPADRAMQAAREASDRAHLEYVATLDPRERAALAPWAA